jgi:hypothetical protein
MPPVFFRSDWKCGSNLFKSEEKRSLAVLRAVACRVAGFRARQGESEICAKRRW